MKIFLYLKDFFISFFYQDDQIPFWNHNSNYYKWIKEELKEKINILDIGCGDGALVNYLSNPNRIITGIDVSKKCIDKANNYNKKNDDIKFICSFFENFDSKNVLYDGIIFCATLHHMDMEKALIKSKNLLTKNGIIIIVGLSKPSSLFDWIIECLRFIPCIIFSKLHKMKSSEDLDIPTSYNIPKMLEIKEILNKVTPGYSISYGLYYRFLVKWVSK